MTIIPLYHYKPQCLMNFIQTYGDHIVLQCINFIHQQCSLTSSFTTLCNSLPEYPHIYNFLEIHFITNNFVEGMLVFQCKFWKKIQTFELREWLFVICQSQHGREAINESNRNQGEQKQGEKGFTSTTLFFLTEKL